MRKPRVLFHGEASYLSTGFAVYTKNVLEYLHKTGKYEVAEFANYGCSRDPRRLGIPWGFYANKPNPDEGELTKIHDSNPMNQFGSWRFEDVLLSFRPDVCLSILDPWQMQCDLNSPFRDYYSLGVMPTVDSNPQRIEWLADFATAQGVFGYCQYGVDVLKEEGRGLIKVRGCASPGANLGVFNPVDDKRAHRRALNIPEDWFIVGSIMRNQKRKLYPDLCEAFRMFLDQASPELAERSYLYLHMSYPDVGWDVPFLLKRYGLGRKVLFSYICTNCRAVMVNRFQDARAVCVNCNHAAACPPHVNMGVPEQTLSSIINLFDYYVQWANREGFGMPAVEAASCGVPVLGTDYASISDVTRKVNGFPIKVLHKQIECEVQADSCTPDNKALAAKLLELANLPASDYEDLRKRTRQGVLDHFTYEKAAKAWEEFIDECPIHDWSQTWDSPIKQHRPASQEEVPKGMNTQEFVDWAVVNVWGRPDKLHTYQVTQIVKWLNYGVFPDNPGGHLINEESVFGQRSNMAECNAQIIYNMFVDRCNQQNQWEQRRTGVINLPPPEFVQQALMDQKMKVGR